MRYVKSVVTDNKKEIHNLGKTEFFALKELCHPTNLEKQQQPPPKQNNNFAKFNLVS